MTAQDLITTDALSCPAATILLTGTTEAFDAATVPVTAAWTDGYKAKFEITLGAISVPSVAPTGWSTSAWTGACIGTELTAAAAVNGAYCLMWKITENSGGTSW